jgi:hypothetical protein
VLNNPLRYIDPTGHDEGDWNYWDMWVYVDYVPGYSDTGNSPNPNISPNPEINNNEGEAIDSPEEGRITLSGIKDRWDQAVQKVKSVFSPKSSDNSDKSSEPGEGGKITLPNYR